MAVNLIDKSGAIFDAADDEEAEKQIQAYGVRRAEPEEVQAYELQQQYGGLGDKIDAFATTTLGTLPKLAEAVSKSGVFQPTDPLTGAPIGPTTIDQSTGKVREGIPVSAEQMAPSLFTERAKKQREANPNSAAAGAVVPDIATAMLIPGGGVAGVVGSALMSGAITEAGSNVIDGDEFSVKDMLMATGGALALEGVGALALKGAQHVSGKARSYVDSLVGRSRELGAADAIAEAEPAIAATKLRRNDAAVYESVQSDFDKSMHEIDQRLVETPEVMFSPQALKTTVSANAKVQEDAFMDLAVQLDHAASQLDVPAVNDARDALQDALGKKGNELYAALHSAKRDLEALGSESPVVQEAIASIDTSLRSERTWGKAAKTYGEVSGDGADVIGSWDVRDIKSRDALEAKLERARTRATATGDKDLAKHISKAETALERADKVTGSRLMAETTPDDIAQLKKQIEGFEKRGPKLAKELSGALTKIDKRLGGGGLRATEDDALDYIAARVHGLGSAERDPIKDILRQAEKHVDELKRAGASPMKISRAQAEINAAREAADEINQIPKAAKRVRQWEASPARLKDKAVDEANSIVTDEIENALQPVLHGGGAAIGGAVFGVPGYVGGYLLGRLTNKKFGGQIAKAIWKKARGNIAKGAVHNPAATALGGLAGTAAAMVGGHRLAPVGFYAGRRVGQMGTDAARAIFRKGVKSLEEKGAEGAARAAGEAAGEAAKAVRPTARKAGQAVREKLAAGRKMFRDAQETVKTAVSGDVAKGYEARVATLEKASREGDEAAQKTAQRQLDELKAKGPPKAAEAPKEPPKAPRAPETFAQAVSGEQGAQESAFFDTMSKVADAKKAGAPGLEEALATMKQALGGDGPSLFEAARKANGQIDAAVAETTAGIDAAGRASALRRGKDAVAAGGPAALASEAKAAIDGLLKDGKVWGEAASLYAESGAQKATRGVLEAATDEGRSIVDAVGKRLRKGQTELRGAAATAAQKTASVMVDAVEAARSAGMSLTELASTAQHATIGASAVARDIGDAVTEAATRAGASAKSVSDAVASFAEQAQKRALQQIEQQSTAALTHVRGAVAEAATTVADAARAAASATGATAATVEAAVKNAAQEVAAGAERTLDLYRRAFFKTKPKLPGRFARPRASAAGRFAPFKEIDTATLVAHREEAMAALSARDRMSLHQALERIAPKNEQLLREFAKRSTKDTAADVMRDQMRQSVLEYGRVMGIDKATLAKLFKSPEGEPLRVAISRDLDMRNAHLIDADPALSRLAKKRAFDVIRGGAGAALLGLGALAAPSTADAAVENGSEHHYDAVGGAVMLASAGLLAFFLPRGGRRLLAEHASEALSFLAPRARMALTSVFKATAEANEGMLRRFAAGEAHTDAKVILDAQYANLQRAFVEHTGLDYSQIPDHVLEAMEAELRHKNAQIIESDPALHRLAEVGRFDVVKGGGEGVKGSPELRRFGLPEPGEVSIRHQSKGEAGFVPEGMTEPGRVPDESKPFVIDQEHGQSALDQMMRASKNDLPPEKALEVARNRYDLAAETLDDAGESFPEPAYDLLMARREKMVEDMPKGLREGEMLGYTDKAFQRYKTAAEHQLGRPLTDNELELAESDFFWTARGRHNEMARIDEAMAKESARSAAYNKAIDDAPNDHSGLMDEIDADAEKGWRDAIDEVKGELAEEGHHPIGAGFEPDPYEEIINRIKEKHVVDPNDEIFLRKELGEDPPDNLERWVSDAVEAHARYADEGMELNADDIVHAIESGETDLGNHTLSPWEEYHVRQEFDENPGYYQQHFDDTLEEHNAARAEDEEYTVQQDAKRRGMRRDRNEDGERVEDVDDGLPRDWALENAGLKDVKVFDNAGIENIFGKALSPRELRSMFALDELRQFAKAEGSELKTVMQVDNDKLFFDGTAGGGSFHVQAEAYVPWNGDKGEPHVRLSILKVPEGSGFTREGVLGRIKEAFEALGVPEILGLGAGLAGVAAGAHELLGNLPDDAGAPPELEAMLEKRQEHDEKVESVRDRLGYVANQSKTVVATAARALASPMGNTRTVAVLPGVTNSQGVKSFMGTNATLQEAFAEKRETLDKIAKDPMALVNELTEGLGELRDTAPALHEQMVAQTYKIVQFLQGKLPGTIGTSLSRPEGTPPNAIALRQFALYYSAATDPGSVMVDLSNNRARREQVDTLREVWEPAYNDLKQQLVGEMAKGRPTVAQRQRMDLLFDFGDALDTGLSSRLMALAASLPADGAKDQGGGDGGGSGAPGKVPGRRTQPSVTAASATGSLSQGAAGGGLA